MEICLVQIVIDFMIIVFINISKGEPHVKYFIGTAFMMDLHLPLDYHTMGISLLELSR